MNGDRVVFDALRPELESYRGMRILEIGPKHGEDSRLLSSLNPSAFTLIDLPEKSGVVRTWLSQLPDTEFVEGNLLYLTEVELEALGRFDLVWCLGVLYHNVEQIRLLRRLFELTADGGMVVVESATARTKRLTQENIVEVHWPETYRGVPTITHLPSRRAIASWLEMVGFADVVDRSAVYSRTLRWQRAVVTGRRLPASAPYEGYGEYVAGTAN